MKDALQLLRVAVGQPKLPAPEQFPHELAKHFQLYRIQMPLPDFRGFYPNWTFAILTASEKRLQSDSIQEVYEESRNIYLSLKKLQKPILYISDDVNIKLREQAPLDWDDAFCLDANDLKLSENKVRSARSTPIAVAVRSKPQPNRFAMLYSPFPRGAPAESWQFFGREKELDDLVNSTGNVIVVGGRRVGKTSLLQEVRRQIKNSGDEAYYVNLQAIKDRRSVTQAIIREISPRDAEAAIRRGKAVGETALSTLLNRIKARRESTTLILDEMGNVLADLDPENWALLGELRKHSQDPGSRLRIILSAFQEVFLRQRKDFSGPLINFGRTLRLGVFSREEAEQAVVSPLLFWHPSAEKDRKALMEPVINKVGFHPYFLQFYCHAIVKAIVENPDRTLEDNAALPIRRNLADSFRAPVSEVFENIPYSTYKYLFLKRCREAFNDRKKLHDAVIDDEWIASTLRTAGFKSTDGSRRSLLDGLEVFGLCTAPDGTEGRQLIAAPIIFFYYLSTASSQGEGDALDRRINNLREDIAMEYKTWDLVPM
jgi:AAA ATPase domain